MSQIMYKLSKRGLNAMRCECYVNAMRTLKVGIQLLMQLSNLLQQQSHVMNGSNFEKLESHAGEND